MRILWKEVVFDFQIIRKYLRQLKGYSTHEKIIKKGQTSNYFY
jgi:hypothetical protein